MRTRWHLLALAAVAGLIGVAFLQEPGFGDDLTYWSFAFDLHERGLVAWQKASFHDLRWPVWGVCWVLQAVLGPGLLSYYGEPLLYLAGGALVAFALGKRLAGSVAAAWGAGLAFLFHPLLDTVSYRPMPDLSEGVWGAAIVLAWWATMQARTRGLAAVAAAATGAGIFIIEANRVTGVFIVPIVVLCTLLYFPRRFGWVVFAGAVSAALYAGECFFYHRLFGDWLHDLTANSGNKGAKGTEFPHPWMMPFRFFDTLWKGNPLAPFYCLLAATGLYAAWRRHGVLGRVLVVWFAGLYLLISCAPQSLWPYRPLVRDADRFLCALVVPMSVLAVAGLWFWGEWLGRHARTAALAQRLAAFARRLTPIGVGTLAAVVLFAVTSRDRFTLGFIPEMRRYMDSRPTGTRVFSHKAMREFAFLIHAAAARRLEWTAPNEILHRTDALEAMAAGCAEFWYARKLVWLNTRKALEKRTFARQPALASCFAAPERDWTLTRVFIKTDNPDLVVYRRRPPGAPAPQILGPDTAEAGWKLPPLPFTLDRTRGTVEAEWAIPEPLRGRLARFEIEAASAHVEALTVRVRFAGPHGDLEPELLLKPYLYAEGGREFFTLPLPAEAQRCRVKLQLSRSAREVVFTGFRAVVEPR